MSRAAEQRPLTETKVTGTQNSDELLVSPGGAATAGPDTPVHLLVEKQAAINGDDPAVVDGAESVTYADLVRRSNTIAAELLARNVQRGDLVGVCLPRGIDAVASLLAILKVGATCVPLALEQPVSRLAFIREDSGLTLTVTTTDVAEKVGVEPEQAVCLDMDLSRDAAGMSAEVPVDVSGDDIAYALYTSGSTGTPKAALLTHANISNFVQWCLESGVVDADSRMAHATNLGFDAAILDIFAPLAAGAVVYVVHREVVISPAATVRWFVDNQITVGFLTTRVAEACLAEEWPAETALRCLVTGGEQVTTWLPPHIPFDVLQIYGPTECTVCVATKFLPPEPPVGGLPPFGRPVRNTRIYLLDSSGKPVADGEPGELYVSGAPVGAGYLGRPELTTERYLPDPFVPGARMYRTGDLCRMNSEGDFEFVGRVDHQVKLRGHRIELNEIENTLASHPDVNDVVVLLREDEPGKKRLAAYLTCSSAEPPAASELRRHVSERLPYYMMPTAFVPMPRFPLTPNNKVDRNALPAPENSRQNLSTEYVAPRTETERGLVAYWQELMGITPVGTGDDFYSLGGDSLMAGRIVDWIRRNHGADIPFSCVLGGITVRELATLIEDRADGKGPTSGHRVAIGAHDESDPVAATSGQFGLWLQEQLAPEDRAYSETALLTIRGSVEPGKVQDTLTELVRRHAALRTNLQMVEGKLQQIVSEPTRIPLELHELTSESGMDVPVVQNDLVEQLTRKPFDLAHGPLLRAALLRVEPKTHVLVLVVHHVAVDGWSLDVLFEEFTQAYAAAAGHANPEFEPARPFADFAAWQNQQLRTDGFAPSISYWRGQLDGAPAELELPLDHERPASATGPAAVVQATLSPKTVRRMRELGSTEHLTSFMIVLAAYQAALARWTGTSDVVVGAPLANRPAGFDRTVGYFLNMVPLRSDISGSGSVRELLSRVRGTVLGAHDHQDVPFPHLVDQLGGARAAGPTPIFQVGIVSQEVQRRSFTSAGIDVEYRNGRPIGAKWDLTLHMIANRVDAEPGLRLELEYRADLFAEDSMTRLLNGLCDLLESGVEAPDRQVGNWVAQPEGTGPATPRTTGRPARDTPPDRRISGGTAALVEAVRTIWEETIGVTDIGLDDTLFDVGGSSLHVPEIHRRVTEQFDVLDLALIDVFNYPTLRTYSAHLADLVENVPAAARPAAPGRPEPEIPGDDRAIAIIGMSGQFPGARSVDELWSLLRDGQEGITHGIDGPEEPDWVPSAGILADRDGFDSQLFELSPADADLMDPQMRRFLETAWAALEDSGYGPKTQGLPSVGVYGGSSFPRDWAERFAAAGAEPGSTSERRLMNGNPWQNLATQVAYRLGLTGPAVDVQTACSTSLVAVHMACRGLIEGDCDMALAGGVGLTQSAGYRYEDGGILSPDGVCRPFDADAQGTLPGNGVGIVVLKPLNRALADHDTVHAVIRGSAINNDGSLKVGFFAPSVEGQRRVVRSAWEASGVTAESISYIETHGTATVLGDSVEVSALTQAVRADTDRAGFCALGSAKSNLGHLDAAAGVTGLIKAALAVKNGVIPATLHFRRPNAELGKPNSPFYVNATTIPWPEAGPGPRRAAVSAFGIGGTNAHLVVEEPPSPGPTRDSARSELLLLSARTPVALDTVSQGLAEHLSKEDPRLDNVAFTLRHGRSALRHRRAVVRRTAEEAASALRPEEQHQALTGVADPGSSLRLVFMFPGVTTQHVGMGQYLYENHQVYRAALDQCADLFATSLGIDIRELVFPGDKDAAAAEELLLRPSRNMAAIFATEYALACLFDSWGIRPDAVIGHSLGEYSAACVSGMLSLQDAAHLVALRGKLCDELPESAMLAVALDGDSLTARLPDPLTVAARNGPRSHTVSGPLDAVEAFRSTLEADGIRARRLPIKAGLHSPLVEPFLDEFARSAATIAGHAPRVPVVSNVTGEWFPQSGITDPMYWVKHLRQTVLFEKGLATLLESGDDNTVLLEVGPGRTMATLARLHPQAATARRAMSPLPAPTAERTERVTLLETVGQLWCDGVDIDWEAFDSDAPHARVQLPTYPFERQTVAAKKSAPPVTAERPRTTVTDGAEVTTTLTTVWADLLGVADPGQDDNFFDQGGHSLLAVEFSSRVRRELGTPVGAHLLLEHPTFGELVSHLQQLAGQGEGQGAAQGEARSAILTELQRGKPDRTPIFMVQPIGGTVFTYQAFAQNLGSDRSVYAFRAVGLEEGEKPYESIPEMASRYVDELLAVQPEGPHIIGGHSSGGVVSYEMAHQLIERGIDTPLVVMIDTVTSDDSHALKDVEDVEKMVDTLLGIAPESTSALRTAIAEDPLIRGVVMQTNLALSRYYPKPCPVPAVYFRAEERDTFLDPHADTWWEHYCRGGIEMHTIPGNHFSVMDEPQIGQITKLLDDCLTQREGAR
ncbi:amino acid adenylation domain-containing protein [Streptomyces klenkii]|uniref:non-ribosomal peptide synthetase/type I polyketide synthase n=1 Tax=Streptomyces klenkii TaxID=1420899 RepID=UPI0033E5C216